MKFSGVTATAVALGASLAAAQSMVGAGNLPQCSLQCFVYYIPMTGCSLTDYKCQCTPAHQQQIQSGLTDCVKKNCMTDEEQIQVSEVVNAICMANGGMAVSESIPASDLPILTSIDKSLGITPAAGAATSAASSAATSAMSMSSAMASSGASMTSAMMTSAAAGAGSTPSTSAAATSASSAMAAGSAPTTFTGGAAKATAWAGMAAAAGLAALAM